MALTGTHSTNDTGHVADHNLIDGAITQANIDIAALQEAVGSAIVLEDVVVPQPTVTTGGDPGLSGKAPRADHSHPQGVHNHLNSVNGGQLTQAATHQSADTDAGLTSIHHTLGQASYQAASGDHQHQTIVVPTSGRPSAVSSGQGAIIFDSTLNLPIFSDGTVWKNFAGTPV